MIGAMARGAATRERILDAAEGLVLEHGFGSTTIDAVLAVAKSSKGAFFHHFASKADLGIALVERYATADVETLERLMRAAEAESDDPAQQLLAFLAAYETMLDDLPSGLPGCLFVSFIYESDLGGPDTVEIVRRTIVQWRERILEKLEAAVAVRPGLPDLDLPSLADQVFTVFEGGFLLARALHDPTALRRQFSHFRHYVELLLADPVRRPPRSQARS
jgi:TetR/AcrR family transcriptional repressor of nem operon